MGWILIFFVAISGFAGPGDKLTDPETARKLGISVQQVHSLRVALNVSNEALLDLSPVDLQEVLRDLGHPGQEKHAGEVEFRALRMMDEHGKIPPDGLMRALEHRKHVGGDNDLFPAPPDPSPDVPNPGTPGSRAAGIQSGGWTWLGPGNIGGRVRSILIHPTLTNILWCGGVDGGVWKSTNNGAAWFPLNDFMANLAVACMAMDPSNPNVIYTGTGEPTYNVDSIRGAGIFKTVDGGSNWVQLSSTANPSFLYVGRIAIDPNNGQTLLAATRSGVFRSVNGGTNWTQTTNMESLCVVYHPTDSSQALASGYNGNAIYSSNGGQTWTVATGMPTPSGFVVGRVELAYSRSSPTTVYASMDNNSGEVYGSTDGGQSYSLLNSGNSYLSGQGWYDNFVWADPVNVNNVIVGGTDVWRSTDGGSSFTDIGGYTGGVHPDQHILVANPQFNGTTIKNIYLGNDGGVFAAANAYTVSSSSGWTTLNHNLGITQFYGGAGNTNSGTIVGGTQDNGDLRYTPGGGTGGWTSWEGGDGGYSAADATDPNYFYGEYVYLQIHRSANGAVSGTDIYSGGLTDAGSSANFIAPFILDPNNSSTLLGGGASLWRTTNAKSGSPGWSAIKASSSSYISAIAVAPGNSDIIWVGYNNGDVYSTANGTAGSPTWTRRDQGSPNLPNRTATRFAIAPGAPNRVYVTFGGFSSDNIYRTDDSGVTWTNITANLPAAPINSVVIAPADTNTLYVGTEVGVFGSSDNGAHWSTGNDGPANVAVDELFWMGSKLVAVTHGRGMFSITPLLGGVNLVNNGATLSGGNGNATVDPNECSQVALAIQNVGGTIASNITAALTTSTPGVTVSQGASAYPNITNGLSANNSTPFQISTSPSFTCGTTVTLTLSVTYAGGSNVLTYTLPSGSTNYTLTTSSGASIVPGVTDAGNHGDDTTTTITLPFPYTFYGQTYSSATLDSNGRLSFAGFTSQYQNNCIPAGYSATVDAFWDDLRTDGSIGTAQGIFTSTSGSAPNRIFNIEWRASYYSANGTGNPVNFEVRMYEGQLRLDIIYGTLNGNGSSATVGLENNSASYVQYGCNSSVLSSGLQLTFQQACVDGGGQCFVAPPVAGFFGAPTNGFAPLAVVFTNLTTGATNYLWDFGNGTNSTATNPTNIYANAGTYSVKLTAVGAGGTNTLTRTNYVVVQAPAKLLVSPASLNFGLLNTGVTAQASFVVSNGGAATLNGSAALSAGAFSITSGTPFSVGAALFTNVVVKFAPVSSGVFSNAVILISNGGNSTNTVLGRATARPALVSQPPAGGNYDFTFATLSGFTYVVQYKDVLTNPVWQTLQTVPGDGLMHTVTNSLASPAQRFYRLMVQ